MNVMFSKMATNVADDESEALDHRKATLKMIANVGLRPIDGNPIEFEIFALNHRGRAMPPTEINGASRRTIALAFVLALCEVSQTRAPLVADSLLNFMSGVVRSNTLRVTATSATPAYSAAHRFRPGVADRGRDRGALCRCHLHADRAMAACRS